jgi:hypothetical protein
LARPQKPGAPLSLASCYLSDPCILSLERGRPGLLQAPFTRASFCHRLYSNPRGLSGLQWSEGGAGEQLARRPARERPPGCSRKILMSGWERQGCYQQRSSQEALAGTPRSEWNREVPLDTKFNSEVRLRSNIFPP